MRYWLRYYEKSRLGINKRTDFIYNMCSDGYCRSCRWRGCIANIYATFCIDKQKIINELTIVCYRLSSYTSWVWLQIL